MVALPCGAVVRLLVEESETVDWTLIWRWRLPSVDAVLFIGICDDGKRGGLLLQPRRLDSSSDAGTTFTLPTDEASESDSGSSGVVFTRIPAVLRTDATSLSLPIELSSELKSKTSRILCTLFLVV